jgi:hypothetical protein
MKDAAFSRAAVPEPYRILGKQLLPFLLGHEILFQRFGVAYSVEAPSEPSFPDLIMGVLICSRKPEQMLKSMRRRSFPIKMRIWGKICGRFDMFEKFELFKNYMNEGREIPQLWPKAGEEVRVSKTSFAETLYSMLRVKNGLSHNEAMNTELWPLLRGIVANAEINGKADIKGAGDDEVISEGLKFLEEVLAGKHFNVGVN